ncbi:glycosyltransferase family 2 protein [Planococcus shixiaomingii]|uniref:glycosyltransferase family 2 protein n=1 Tax=Planococcus shixiaomingii TaxID=3058393 RepID=UPI002614BCC2|nr:glycosyltransferase family 2 protein [Planococcus sp. N022]WKA53975.1 glycosyltransferase family 2 protein [Planococcus sp. N022]
MDIDYLVSTINQSDYSIVKNMNICENNYVVINQVFNNEVSPPADIHTPKRKFISVLDKGLSKSRNMAIKNSEGEICVICDDDMDYTLPADKINEYYNQYPKADIIIFKVDGINKNYWKKITKLSFLKTMKVSSVQITFKRENIISAGITFDEEFGAGAKYFFGEENILLWDCLRKNLNIIFVPEYIGNLNNNRPSSWFTGYDENYFFSKGAVFYRMSKLLSLPLVLQFAIRKYKTYHRYINIFKAVAHMLRGRKDLLKE